ncbi:ficolin-1-like [Bactrocera tryoni]|uniref:ficolin-1-like n=1 Tax=Bactrocera tryoni TaxID=59916 RepID=UPI001A97B641|nr:ficolin-1-like [Bactrocera tryoni]
MRSHNGSDYYAKYSQFFIAAESEDYALKILDDYSGTAGDSLTKHLGKKFSTYDRDNDDADDQGNCALHFKGAWWFGNCYDSHLNGVYGSARDGVNSNSIKFEESLLVAQMMI